MGFQDIELERISENLIYNVDYGKLDVRRSIVSVTQIKYTRYWIKVEAKNYHQIIGHKHVVSSDCKQTPVFGVLFAVFCFILII